MTYPDLPLYKGPTLEILDNRYDLLKLMLESHLRWMHQTHDEYLREIHRSLAEQLEITLKHYGSLIDALQAHS